MLLDNFFYILKLENAGQSLKTQVRIDKHHKIFNGHFPAVPIVPGVCMIEMIREIAEKHFGRRMKVDSADNVKFLMVINPMENDEIQADVDYEEITNGSLRISATLFAGELIFFKLKAILQPLE